MCWAEVNLLYSLAGTQQERRVGNKRLDVEGKGGETEVQEKNKVRGRPLCYVIRLCYVQANGSGHKGTRTRGGTSALPSGIDFTVK